ncbi:MAG: hypothetical protein CVU90_07040 [Firmicutes bacterium HGW-Firmicutes-15]|nr:MAG: hypothetical protein CVU90_07040 [Firmicutes bacterium HGW-Firmicutes-15]
MNHWPRNISMMKTHFTGFYEKGTSKEFTYNDLQIVDNGNENLILQSSQGCIFLHSSFSIEREMQELFKGIDDPEQVLIIFGLGMGHCLDYIQKHKIKYRQILILEPYNNIFQEMLKRRNLESLLKKRDVSLTLFNDARQIQSQIMGQVMSSRKVRFLSHLSYRSVFSDVYQEISRIFRDEKRSFLSSRTTVDYFLHDWTENQLISIARKQPSAAVFNDRFKNIPAIIVSAGPSLEKRVDELKEIQDKALIIAPGTGAKVCNRRGIKAHMIVAMDSLKIEANIFKDNKIDILIGSYRLHPEVDKVFSHRFLRMMVTNEVIAQYFHHYFGLPAEVLNDHASVSSTAIDYAVKLGCNPIILVGQDLCFYDNKVHADEQKDSLSAITKRQLQTLVDINGETVQTTPTFLAIRRDMEIINLQYQNTCTIINATEAGLGIPGVENRKFRDVIDQYINPREDDMGMIIEETLNNSTDLDAYTELDIDSFYEHILTEIEKLEIINEEKLIELQELHKGIQRGLKESRLRGYVEAIKEKNRQFEESAFYKKVVAQMLNHFLIYYKAGTLYSFGGQSTTSEAEFYYESNVYDMTSRYLKMVKGITERELKLFGENRYEDGSLNVPINQLDNKQEVGLTIPFAKQDKEQETTFTLPFNNK